MVVLWIKGSYHTIIRCSINSEGSDDAIKIFGINKSGVFRRDM
jgi:hypothetical protein